MVKLLESNRWLVVVGAILIQLALGAIYAWSAFTNALKDPAGFYAFSRMETFTIFAAGIATFAVVMVGAGKKLPSWGPRKLTVISAFVLGAGYIAGGLFGETFWLQVYYIGIMGGAGIGFGYVVPLAVGLKWFPDKKGLVTGLGVAGFGFGATIWIKLAGPWLNLITDPVITTLPGVQSTFVVYGITFFTLVLIGSLLMENPRPDWKPAGWSPAKLHHTARENITLTPREMLRTKEFWKVFSIFFFSALAGLMVITSLSEFGTDVLEHNGVLAAAAVLTVGTAAASLAIFNGLGRIVWGSLSDRFGRHNMVVWMVALQGITMMSTYHLFIFFGQEWGLIIVASIIGFNFGGNFALMPAWTADLFGSKHAGSNYPWIFLAYGVAGIAGPLLAGFFGDIALAANETIYWMVPYLSAGVMCLIGAGIAKTVRKPDTTPTLEPQKVAVEKA